MRLLSKIMPHQFPKNQLLVEATITINNKKYSTFIKHGASAEELIEKIAKENGGGVAKVFYKEFNAYEIVAVKIGNDLLVKGDSKRVAEADFSAFINPQLIRKAAIMASISSQGGIHFFVNDGGIPAAMDSSENLVFPNADELRINSNIRNLSIKVVDNSADPSTLSELQGLYKQEIKITGNARSIISKNEFEKSHGGFRSEKLLLPDTSVIIIDSVTGTVHSPEEKLCSPIDFTPPEFFYKPNFVHSQLPYHEIGLTFNTDLGPMVIPFDGSIGKVPYLYIRKFDGHIKDQLKMTFGEEILQLNASLKEKILEKFEEENKDKKEEPKTKDNSSKEKTHLNDTKKQKNPKEPEIEKSETHSTSQNKSENEKPKQLDQPKATKPKATKSLSKKSKATKIKQTKKGVQTKDETSKEKKQQKISVKKTIETSIGIKKQKVPFKINRLEKTKSKKKENKIKSVFAENVTKNQKKKPDSAKKIKKTNIKTNNLQVQKKPILNKKEKKPKKAMPIKKTIKAKEESHLKLKESKSNVKNRNEKLQQKNDKKKNPFLKEIKIEKPKEILNLKEKNNDQKKKKVSSYYLNSMLGILGSKKPRKKI